ncbi:MAG: hypothetical protein AAF806_22080 [Bacteroidota bacterium]
MRALSFMLCVSVGLFFHACNQTEELLPENIGDGIFPNTQKLIIDTLSGRANFPQFDLNQPNLPQRLYIAVFDKEIKIENQEIQNQDDIIWQWDSSMDRLGLVTFEDGNLIDSTYSLSKVSCSDLPTLYWAAWAWDEEAQQIAYSTKIHTFQLLPDQLPQLLVQQIDLVGEEEADGYLQAGEEITLKAVIKNIGEQAANNISVKLYGEQQNRTIDLPISHNIESIVADGFQDVYFTFNLPNGLGIEEILEFKIDLSYNDCLFSEPFAHQLTITGREVCLYRVTLVRIKSIPPEGGPFWDHWLQIGFQNPDPYYILTEEGNEVDIIYSEVLQDVPPNNPLEKTWSPLSPCKPLKLDKIYSIEAFDKDYSNEIIENADDYIGDVKFVPKDFLESNETTHIIESESIVVKIELIWQ